ncbi:MAG: VWA domain-containing protein, partial [Rhizobacter sp.]|nr:VWA domain-containing protein [Chlorobiales bacterium]
SGSGAFGSINQFKRDLAAEISATLAFSAIKNNDKVGLIIFTDTVELFIAPRKGRKNVLRILREIFFFKPKSRRTNIASALTLAARILKRRTIVFLVSDLMDKNYDDALKLMNKKHDFVTIHISDPLETELPRVGLVELTDAETGEHFLADTSDAMFRKNYELRMKQLAEQRKKQFQKLQIDMVGVSTARSYIKPLAAFFRQRDARY